MSNDIGILLKRFANFADSAVKAVHILNDDVLQVELDVQDDDDCYRWKRVRLSFACVSEFKLLRQSNSSICDTSLGISYRREGDQHYFRFGWHEEEPTVEEITSSEFYIVCKEVEYEVTRLR